VQADSYNQDGLTSVHNHEFMCEARFVDAYRRGVVATGQDYQWHWRVHIGLWAAQTAARLPGDFVECGVNKGFLSSSIMQLLDWDRLGKQFYLLDTFRGIDSRFLSEDDVREGVVQKNNDLLESGFYATEPETVRRNFSEWRNVQIIEGAIPETLSLVRAERVAYLHIDLNCAAPEIAALTHFWDRLVIGAPVLLDDYGYHGYRHQKLAMDELASRFGVSIASLPTGQGLLLKT
jgi:hypothetical protein